MKRSLRHTLVLGLICLAFALPPIGVYAVWLNAVPAWMVEAIQKTPLLPGAMNYCSEFFIKSEGSIRDMIARHGKTAPVDDRLIFLAIDSDSVQLDVLDPEEIAKSPALALMAKGFPWSRAVYPMILDRLFQSGARVVAIDLLFPLPSPNDKPFFDALERYRDSVVIGCNFVVAQDAQTSITSLDTPTETIVPATSPLDARIGFVNFFPDLDAIIRRAQYSTTQSLPEGQRLPSLLANALKKFDKECVLPSTSRLIRFAGPAGTYRPIPIWMLFHEKSWKQNLKDGAVFKDKLVVLGPNANSMHDEHDTPFGKMPGPELHLQAANAALNGEFLNELPMRVNFLLMLAAGLLAWFINLIIKHPVAHLGAVVIILIGYLAGLQILYNHAGYFILSLAPTLIFASGSLVTLTYEFLLVRRERARVRSTLEKYVSQNVVKELLDHSKEYEHSLGGARKNVTVLFSDIRGFTTMTEGADSQALVAQLNEYLTEMVECVFNHNGTLDKFIGDAVMAVWGNALSHGKEMDAVNAVRTALAMRRALEKLNQKWKIENREPLHIGIGLNHGEVIVGNMGSPKRMEFTVIGDAVNLASRLEGLTKQYHVDILIGETVAPLVENHFHLRSVALVQVKGKSKPVATFTVIGEKEIPLSNEQIQLFTSYEKGLQEYCARQFREASLTFAQCLDLAPADFLSQMYLNSSRELLQNPPDDSWTGVTIMTSK
ncbi:MAG: CHASE2 domain-containing protein [Verrucomicrobiota bacterium]